MIGQAQSRSGALARVGIVTVAQFRFLILEILKELKKRHGSTIHLFCHTPEEEKFYRAQNTSGLLASVQNAGILMTAWEEGQLNEADEIATARRFEGMLGTTYNELAAANRHFGRGYSLGGTLHPRSRQSEESSYLQMVHAFNAQLAFWQRAIAEHKLTLMINGPGHVARMCRALGVPWRALTSARHENLHYWAEIETLDFPRFAEAYARCEDVVSDAGVTETYLVQKEVERRFHEDLHPLHLAKNVAWMLARAAYWRIRGYQKGRSYRWQDEVAYYWRRWRDARRLSYGRRIVQLDALSGRPFVFFPLQTEPEQTLVDTSPEFQFQLLALAALARDVPAGVLVATKEALWAAGRRPPSFYAQIADLKNVVMLDIREPGLNVIRQASAVATISSTAGLEAAALGKPVISFGSHNVFNCVPHAWTVDDIGDITEAISRCLSPDFDAEKARRDGALLLATVKRLGFDLGKYDYFDMHSFDGSVVDAASRALEGGLIGQAACNAA